MRPENANLSDCKRYIETALADARFEDCRVETKLDGDGKVFAEVTIGGRTARGLPGLVLDAIEEAKNYGIPITQAFESRNMYGASI